MNIRYPEVEVQLSGQDGNPWVIIGAVARALRGQVSAEAAAQWSREAMDCESYDELLRLAMQTVDVA